MAVRRRRGYGTLGLCRRRGRWSRFSVKRVRHRRLLQRPLTGGRWTHHWRGLPVEKDGKKTEDKRDANGGRGRRQYRNPEETYQCGKSAHAEDGGNDIELARLEHERLFAHQDIADQTTAHGI